MTGPPWCRRRCGAPFHKSQHAPLPWESGVVYGSLHCWRCPPAAQERGRPMHGDSSLTVSGPPNARSPPSAADVRAQLDILLASPDFDVPARARRFLSYVVEETLAGRGDRIKAYSVGMEVFGRDQNFDAQSDPAVRIEAGRIRRALAHYYLAAGLAALAAVLLVVVLLIPSRDAPVPASQASMPGLPEGPTLAVMPFANL